MLTALTAQTMRHVVSFETEKAEGPFICPECRQEVVLKKGDIKKDYFSHLPSSTCVLSENESPAHRYAKIQMYMALKKSDECNNIQLEHYVGRRRTDVYAEIRNKPVAIELQASKLEPKVLAERTHDYKKNDTYCIWIIVGEAPGGRYSVPPWIRLLHAMYLGRVYYWFDTCTVYPAHFGKYKFTPGTRCDAKFYNQERPVHLLRQPMDIVNFVPLQRPKFSYLGHLHIGMPDCLLWRDELEPWWDNASPDSNRTYIDLSPNW